MKLNLFFTAIVVSFICTFFSTWANAFCPYTSDWQANARCQQEEYRQYQQQQYQQQMLQAQQEQVYEMQRMRTQQQMQQIRNSYGAPGY